MRISIIHKDENKKIKKAIKEFNIFRAIEFDGDNNIRNVELIDKHGTIFRGFGKTRKDAIKRAFKTLKNNYNFNA